MNRDVAIIILGTAVASAILAAISLALGWHLFAAVLFGASVGQASVVVNFWGDRT